MTQNIPARRPAIEAQPGDIVQSQSGSNHALWKVEAVREVQNFGLRSNTTRKVLDLRSLKSGRTDYGRSALWMEVLSPEEVARIQAKKVPKPDYRAELIEALEGLLRARNGDKLRQESDPLFSTRAHDAADAEYVDDEIVKLENRITELKAATA